MRQQGLTFIEILVGVTIALVLIGLIVTSALRAREAAKDTVALSNIKLVGYAHILYAADNDEHFPYWVPLALPGGETEESGAILRETDVQPTRWKQLLLPYVENGNLFYSPGDPFAKTRTPLAGTRGPANSEETSWTYSAAADGLKVLPDGGQQWTETEATEGVQRTGLPLLIANLVHKPEEKPARLVTVHRLGERVPGWNPDGSVRMVDLSRLR
ncbi:MAG: type II secretion system protein [Armatimonadota bacterium]